MISSIPTVEAYYISLKKDNEEKKSSLEVASNTISMAYDDLQIRWLSNLPVVGAVIAGFWEELEELHNDCDRQRGCCSIQSKGRAACLP